MKIFNTTAHNNKQLQKLSYLDTEPQAMKKILKKNFILNEICMSENILAIPQNFPLRML